MTNKNKEALEDITYVHTRNRKFDRSFKISEETYETIRAALVQNEVTDTAATRKPEQQWQPIETAPKCGTAILVYQVGFYPYSARWAKQFAEQYGDTSAGWYAEGYDNRSDPTHWRPLPQPPKKGE